MSLTLDALAQSAAEVHLVACEDYLLDAEAGIPSNKDNPAVAPYDGCPSCVVREVLFAAWPYVLEIARDEVKRDGQPG